MGWYGTERWTIHNIIHEKKSRRHKYMILNVNEMMMVSCVNFIAKKNNNNIVGKNYLTLFSKHLTLIADFFMGIYCNFYFYRSNKP